MQIELMFTGFGGQGILLMGKIVALTALKVGKEVAWVPSYGPEMRGGTAYCTVVISDKKIGSPVIKYPSHLVAMNRPSLEKFAPSVKPGGVILINTTLIQVDSGRDDVDELKVPVTDIAVNLGTVKVANMVALGAFVYHSKVFDFKTVSNVVKKEFSKKPHLIDLNIEAMEQGKKSVL